MIKPLLIALQFLTRLPVPNIGEVSDEQVGRSLLFYPVVGLIIGGLLALVAWLTEGSSDSVRAVLLLIIWTLITGALHIDGLADSADAWVGGYGDKEKTMDIMKDPYAGPAGVTVILLVLIAKYVSLEVLLSQSNYIILVLVPMLARVMMPLLLLTTDYVRKNGLGSALAVHHPKCASQWIILSCGLLTVIVAGSSGVWLLATLGIVFLYLRRVMIQRIGGTTGDTLGAMVELSEAVGLIALALVI